MAVELTTPDAGELDVVVDALRGWQDDAAPMQLHPGDLGWYWRFGAAATAAALRTWSRDGRLLAVGFLDGPDVVRLTMAPQAMREHELARQIVADVTNPRRGVLPEGRVAVETPDGALVRELLADAGWGAGESWTPLRRDLSQPVERTELRVVTVASGTESEFTAVHRSAWGSPRFTDERWRTMAEGRPFTDARCLLGYDERGFAVAGVTVWSAGPGKPGLLEPVGVHAEHRRCGHGAQMSLAAAAALRELGSSSALVCTRSANTAAVATYLSAGFARLPVRLDRSRES